MRTTPLFGLPVEEPGDEPGITLTGKDGAPILAEAIDTALGVIEDAVEAGFAFGGRLYYTASGVFTKADYPGLRALRVYLVGAGGGGGGAASTSSTQHSVGGGGGGGGFTEVVFGAAMLSATTTIQVGSGGTGVAGANGNAGGASQVLSVAALGGAGGTFNTGTAVGGILFATGGAGGQVLFPSTGDIFGEGGGLGMSVAPGSANGRGLPGQGGASAWSGRPVAQSMQSTAAAGTLYGSGGNGSRNGVSQPARPGGRGADGLVVIDLYM